MNKQTKEELLESHIVALATEQKKGTSPFFYTQLIARMQQKETYTWIPVKPVWIVATLGLLLVINIAFLNRNYREAFPGNENKGNVESFGRSYDFIISNPY